MHRYAERFILNHRLLKSEPNDGLLQKLLALHMQEVYPIRSAHRFTYSGDNWYSQSARRQPAYQTSLSFWYHRTSGKETISCSSTKHVRSTHFSSLCALTSVADRKIGTRSKRFSSSLSPRGRSHRKLRARVSINYSSLKLGPNSA